MDIGPIGASALSTGSSLVEGAGNALFGGISAKRNFKYAKKMADYQNTMNIQNWRMQNEYDSPSAQMARLDEAGLNPNLVYGSGTVVGNSSHQIPSYQAPSPDFPAAKFQLPDVLAVMSAFQNMQVQSTQAKSIEADVTKKNIENQFLYSLLSKNLDTKTLEFQKLAQDLGVYRNDFGYQKDGSNNFVHSDNNPIMRMFDATVNEKATNVSRGRIQNALLQKDLDFYNSLGIGSAGTSGMGKLADIILRMLGQSFKR